MAIKIPRSRVQPGVVPETGAPIVGRQPTPVGVDPAGQVAVEAGRGLQQLGSLAIKVATDLKDRDDKTLAGNSYLDFSNQTREIENKYFSRKGINAQGSFDQYRQDMDNAYNEVINGIESQRAKGLFDSISRSRRISSGLSMQTYERTQLDKAHLETSRALVEDSTQDAIESYNNPIAIQDARNKIIIGVGQTSDLLGWTADQEKVALENAVSKMHVGVINNMVVNDALGAQAYMDANIEEIQGTDRITVEEKVKRNGVLQESQALADDIHSQATADNLSLSEELALIPTDNPDVRKATESLVRQKTKDDEYAELQARDNVKSEVYNIIMDQNVDINGKTHAANSIEHVGDRANALKMVQTIQDRALADKKKQVIKETPIFTFNAKDEIDKGTITNPNQLIEGYFNKVTGSDFNFLLGYLQQGGRIGDLKASVYNTAFRNIFGQPEDNKKTYLGAVEFIRDQVRAGNPPTSDNINKWIITSATLGEEIKGLYFSDMTFAEAEAEGVDHIWLPKIEDFEDDSITEAIKNYNLSTPSDQIEINEFNKRNWKRIQILQLPPPDPSIESLF